jgi:hypothetical protein
MSKIQIVFMSGLLLLCATLMSMDATAWQTWNRSNFEQCAKHGLIRPPLLEAHEAINSNFGQTEIELPLELKKKIKEDYVRLDADQVALFYSFDLLLSGSLNEPSCPDNRYLLEYCHLDWRQWYGIRMLVKIAWHRHSTFCEWEPMECSEQTYNDIISVPVERRESILHRRLQGRDIIQLKPFDSASEKAKWHKKFVDEDDAEHGERDRRTATLVGVGTGLCSATAACTLMYLSGAIKEESSLLSGAAIAGGAFSAGFFAGKRSTMNYMEAAKKLRIDNKHHAMQDFYGGKRSVLDPSQTVFEYITQVVTYKLYIKNLFLISSSIGSLLL